MKILRPVSKQPLPENASRVFEGVLFDVYQWEQAQFDGSIKIFEKLSRNDSVEIIALTPDHKFIVLYEEQPGKALFQGHPGGQIDNGEDPFTAAQRELMEETGYQSNNWRYWMSYQGLSKIEWCNYVFVANDCQLSQMKEYEHDPGEKIKVNYLEFDEWVEFVLDPACRSDKLKLELLLAERQGDLGRIKNFILNQYV